MTARTHHPGEFKGIALFTPGGDVAYCVDPDKREQWHLDLCAALQDSLGLESPPHFLLPCYTATVDRWWDAAGGQLMTTAEVYPRAMRFQALLNCLFDLDQVHWQTNYGVLPQCSTVAIDGYRSQFPQLWQGHDLVLPVQRSAPKAASLGAASAVSHGGGYTFRLFVGSHEHVAVEKILRTLHITLEQALETYTLQVVDVTKHPEQAEADQVSLTPSLVRAWPLPRRILSGDLAVPSRILQLLDAPEP